VPLDPQYDVYLDREALGQVMFICGRDKGEIVAYFVGFVAPGLHYKTCLTLQMDIFYVKPGARGAMAGVRLFKFVEQEARNRGVQRMFVGSKMHKDASWLFERLKYTEVEKFYSKWLGE
jgi:GNAT superfamily N-acetyltransferase